MLDEIKKLMNEAYQLSREHKYDQELNYYIEILKRLEEDDPFYVEVLGLKGFTLLRLGKSEESLLCYEKALELDPYNKGIISLMRENPATLTKFSYNKNKNTGRLNFDPSEKYMAEEDSSLFIKAIRLDRNGNHSEASPLLDTLSNKYPRNTDILKSKGMCLSAMKKYEEALACYRKILDIDPNDSLCYELMKTPLKEQGSIFLKKQDFQNAIDCFDSSLKIDPDDFESLGLKGIALSNLGRHEEELLCYNKALEKNPNNADLLNLKARLLSKQKRYIEAAGTIPLDIISIKNRIKDIVNNKKLKTESKDVTDKLLKIVLEGQAFMLTERFDDAIRIFDEVLAYSPNNIDSLRNKTLVLLKKKDLHQALLCCNQALTIESQNPKLIKLKELVLMALDKKQNNKTPI